MSLRLDWPTVKMLMSCAGALPLCGFHLGVDMQLTHSLPTHSCMRTHLLQLLHVGCFHVVVGGFVCGCCQEPFHRLPHPGFGYIQRTTRL